jgi:hypothetical protein
MKKIGELNDKYGVSLASVIIRLVVKDPIVANLLEYAIREFKFDPTKADALVKEINQLLSQLIPSLVIPVQTGISGPVRQTLDPRLRGDDNNAQISPPLVRGGVPARSAWRGEVYSSNGSEAQAVSRVKKNGDMNFSHADEKEINQFKKELKADGIQTLVSKEEQLVEEILKRANLDLASEFLVDRLKQILKSYIRGIRDKMETGDTLKKPWMQGGLNFDLPTVQKVLKVADEIKIATHSLLPQKPNKINLPEDIARDGEYNLEKELAKGAVKLVQPSYAEASAGKKISTPVKNIPIQPIKPILSSIGGAKKVFFGSAKKLDLSHELNPGVVRKIISAPVETHGNASPQSKIAPVSIPQVPLRSYGSEVGGRPRLDDIKFTPKIMGQVDELKFLNTTMFRRLHPDPITAAHKIKEKINLLAEEYYGKRLEGVKAWRVSPINLLYLAIGEASISQNKSVDAIIEERKLKGEDYLTAQEFDAIMELNRELRY